MIVGHRKSWVLDTVSKRLTVAINISKQTAWDEINHALFTLRLNKLWARTASKYKVEEKYRGAGFKEDTPVAHIEMTSLDGDLDLLPKEYQI